MIDLIQILLTVIVTTLTILLIVIGIEVFKILRESRETLRRFNKIMDNIDSITTSVAKPVEKMSEVVSGFQQGIGVVHFVTNLLEKHSKKAEK